MSPLRSARTTFGILFVAALLVVGGLNAFFHGRPVVQALSAVPEPLTIENAGASQKAARSAASASYVGKFTALSARAEIMVALDKREMDNFSVIKGPDGHLYQGGLYSLDTTRARDLARHMTGLLKHVEPEGTRLLYVAPPDTVAKDHLDLPEAMPILDHNPVSDALLYTLRERRVPALDTRYAFIADGIPGEDITLRTALLMKGRAVFAMFGYMVDAIRREFAVDLDPDGLYRDLDNYTVTDYPDFFMGVLGQRTGPAFSGRDDFSTITPSFDTDFSIEGLDIFNAPVLAEGNANETLFNPDALRSTPNPYTMYPESFYIHTNLSWSRIENRLNPDGPKVLFVHDFYTAQLASLLAPLTSQLHTLTYQENQQESVDAYLEDKDFDLIILSFFPANTLRPEFQTFVYSQEIDDGEEDEDAVGE